MSETLNHHRDPQERSGALERMSRSDMDEKPVQENIQGVGIYLVKKNNPLVRCQLHHKACVNTKGE